MLFRRCSVKIDSERDSGSSRACASHGTRMMELRRLLKKRLARLQHAAQALSDAGLIVEERRPPHVERGNEMWLKLFSRASVVQLRKVYAGRESEGGSFVSWRLATADDTPPPTLDEYIAGWMERDRLREELLRWMETTPIIVAPVGATPAYPHDTLKVTVRGATFGTFRAFSYAQTFNVFDLPVVTVPAGTIE